MIGFANSIEIQTSRNTNLIPLVTGSTAEFYIQPMLSCVGDVDIMLHYTHQLAIPAGTAPPIRLPGDLDSVVRVFEIVDDSRFPGYAYLVSSYLLIVCIEDGRYYAEQIERQHIAHEGFKKLQKTSYVVCI